MKPVMLAILDGWGIRNSKVKNAIKAAKTPNMDKLWKQYPHSVLKASGNVVGLPNGFMGNSEVGHTHLGSGRLLSQEMVRINNSIKDKSFFKNKELVNAMKHAKKNKQDLHLLGLLSDGGVHSHINHLFALLKMAKQYKLQGHTYIHCLLDGRDVPKKSAKKYIKMLQKKIKSLGIGEISSIMGRYYGMDRDNRWNREHKAYDAMVNGKGYAYDDPIKAVSAAYARGETDEFVKPSLIKCTSKKQSCVTTGDSIIFFNFRSDRAREITKAFVQGKFNKFKRKKLIDLCFVCLTQYDKKIKARVAFPPTYEKDICAEILDKNKIKQLRIAETEKYAHVTYFFNNGREKPFKTETRILIPSPRVSTYDKTPPMSAPKILKAVLAEIKKDKHQVIILNFANADMVGHTGDFKAAVKAIEYVDKAVGEIVKLILKKDGHLLITADHGNAEEMTKGHETAHSTNPVPFILVSNNKYKLLPRGSLQNVSPTILDLLKIKRPKCMVKSLIKRKFK